MKPKGGCQKRGKHTQCENLNSACEDIRIYNSTSDRAGDMRSHQDGAQEFEYRRSHDRAFEGKGSGSHRRAHGIGHIISADVPGCVCAGNQGENEDYQQSVSFPVDYFLRIINARFSPVFSA